MSDRTVDRAAIRLIVGELAPRQLDAITDEHRLVDDLEYTSLALTELAFTLEDEYDLQPIDEPTARAIVTAGHICDYVERERHAVSSTTLTDSEKETDPAGASES